MRELGVKSKIPVKLIRRRLASMRNSWKLASLLVLLMCSVARAQSDPRGIYVYSWDVANLDSPAQVKAPGVQDLLNALNSPGVDGITLVFDWSTVETGYHTYEWTTSPPVNHSGQLVGTSSLDLWIQAAISAHKNIILAIRSGQGTPCWLFMPSDCTQSGTYAGATALKLLASAHQGTGKCLPVMMAAPWDSVLSVNGNACSRICPPICNPFRTTERASMTRSLQFG